MGGITLVEVLKQIINSKIEQKLTFDEILNILYYPLNNEEKDN